MNSTDITPYWDTLCPIICLNTHESENVFKILNVNDIFISWQVLMFYDGQVLKNIYINSVLASCTVKVVLNKNKI
jgi:hypothetical protein